MLKRSEDVEADKEIGIVVGIVVALYIISLFLKFGNIEV